MKILITGGAGFIGCSIAMALSSNGHIVTCIDNLSREGSRLNIERLKSSNCIFIQGDAALHETFSGISFDLLIDASANPSVMAGRSGDSYSVFQNNLVTTVACLEACKNNSASIIFLSTSRVYPYDTLDRLGYTETSTSYRFNLDENVFAGVSEHGISEDFNTSDGLRTLYGTTKLCSEMIIREYSDFFQIPSLILRLGVVAGPWQMGKSDQGILGFFVKQALREAPISFIGYGNKGKQVRDFLHVDDLMDFLLLAIDSDFLEQVYGKTFNLGGGLSNSCSLLELTTLIAQKTRLNISPTLEKSRPGDVRIYISDSSKLRSALNWSPTRDLESTVHDVVSWTKGMIDFLP